MPVHIKLMVSALTLLMGGGFFYIESTFGDSQLACIGAGLSIFMVIAMWVFPEAGSKKKS